jgi:hypothetical protein
MLNTDNERRLHDMEAVQAEAQTETRQRLLALDIAGDSEASTLVKLVTAKRAADVIGESRALAGLAAAPPPEPVTVDVGKIEALTKQLKDLSEKPRRWDQLASGLAFAQALRDAYQATAAETQEKAAEANTAAKALAADDKKVAAK